MIYCFLVQKVGLCEMVKKQENEKNYFYEYTNDILENKDFLELKRLSHHGLNRYEHSLRVAKISYRVASRLHLDEKSVARAALLHDFFFEDNMELGLKDKMKTLVNHPKYALNTAKKYFELSEKEEDIIVTHMFPIGIRMPKYLESWLVDIIDDGVAIYERFYGIQKQMSFASSYLFLLLINYLR